MSICVCDREMERYMGVCMVCIHVVWVCMKCVCEREAERDGKVYVCVICVLCMYVCGMQYTHTHTHI